MKYRYFFYLLFFTFITTAAQNDAARILSEDETARIFTESMKYSLGINYPIFRTYTYQDRSGQYFLVLTEKPYKKENNQTLNSALKAFCLKKEPQGFIISWQLQDFIVSGNEANTPEYSIWFWTKYFDIKDFDHDGLIDPIMIYGTSGNDGTEDGRIKFLTYYKGEKYAIRHQNGSLDFERHTQVDAAYYDLPAQIRNHILSVMEKMTANNHAIFPYGYQANMAKRKTYFDENN